MDTKKQQAILYIEANRAFFYPGPAGAMLQLAFPLDVVSDLEVLNSQKLMALVTAFFQSQKILPSEIVFVFAQAMTFEKEFPLEEKKETIQEFLDFIPFDDVISKIISTGKKTKAIAINGQLFTIIRQGCEKANSTVVGVVAYSQLLGLMPELSQKVNIQLMLSHFDNCRQLSLIANTPQPTAPLINKQISASAKDKKRTYILLGIFGGLLIVLVIMVINTLNAPSPKLQQTSTPQSLPTVRPSVINTPVSPSPVVTKTQLQPSQIVVPSTNPTRIPGQ